MFNISKETRWAILRGDWFFKIWKFSSFGNTFFIFFYPFHRLQFKWLMLYYKNYSTFQKKHVGQYSEEIGLIKIQNFHLLVTFFSFFFTVFTIYNLNNSYFIYKNCSIYQTKHVRLYLEGINVFKFGKFHLLVILFKFFNPFHRLEFKKFIFYIWNLFKISTEPLWQLLKGNLRF